MTSPFEELSDAVYRFYRDNGMDRTILALAAVMFAVQELHNMEDAEAISSE